MMSTSTSTENQTSADRNPFEWQVTYLAYGIVMFFILTVGFLGNALTLIVLRYREHRKKAVTPLMKNLAIADIFIIVFGYPVIITANLRGEPLRQNSARCIWSGFSNGVAGISSIATLVAMSGVMYHVIKQTVPNPTIPATRMVGLIAGTWFYGIFVILPPLLGWNRFVPGEAGISCAPDWTASDISSVLYIVWLVAFGFFIPLIAICVLHYLTYKIITRALRYIPGNATIQAKRRNSQMKLLRMTAVCIAAFILSWSPYCFVSLAGTIKGDHVLTSGEAEIPELLAKASVVFNPIIYIVTNSNFRATLWGIINGRETVRVRSNASSVITQNSAGGHTAALNRHLDNSPV